MRARVSGEGKHGGEGVGVGEGAGLRRAPRTVMAICRPPSAPPPPLAPPSPLAPPRPPMRRGGTEPPATLSNVSRTTSWPSAALVAAALSAFVDVERTMPACCWRLTWIGSRVQGQGSGSSQGWVDVEWIILECWNHVRLLDHTYIHTYYPVDLLAHAHMLPAAHQLHSSSTGAALAAAQIG